MTGLPRVRRHVAAPGAWRVPDRLRVRAADERFSGPLAAAQALLAPVLRLVPVADGSADVVLAPLPAGAGGGAAGAHRITVRPDGATVEAADGAGAVHALVSLGQRLAEADAGGLGCAASEDAPAYPYRGVMLDVARHFFPVATVKRVIDLAALLRLNVFHWHLSDDQGWRVESSAFPRLHEIGSRRAATRGDGRPHGGFYSRAEIAEVVAHAADRGVTVVPEIDVPGHVAAILAAYPQLSCRGRVRPVPTRFGIFAEVACPGKAATRAFFAELLDELLELFPGGYFHLGGDEVPRLRWLQCADCRAAMAAHGLGDEADLQAWFMNPLIGRVAAAGKTAIVWNEAVASARLDPRAAMQFWREPGGAPRARAPQARAALAAGRPAILSPLRPYYLDYPHGMWGLAASRSFDPRRWAGPAADSLLGVEAPLWTEYVDQEADIWRRLLPRLFAVAETGWAGSPDADAASFARRVRAADAWLRRLGFAGTAPADADPGRWQAAAETGRFVSGAFDPRWLELPVRAGREAVLRWWRRRAEA